MWSNENDDDGAIVFLGYLTTFISYRDRMTYRITEDLAAKEEVSVPFVESTLSYFYIVKTNLCYFL
jgi:hypothetical protein